MNHQQMLKPMLIGAAAFVVLGLLGLPVLNYLPLLIILGCPLMMIFMMGGHNHGGEAQDHSAHDHSHAGHDRREGL